jgi:hypothetical protein
MLRLEGLGQLKNATTSGIEPPTFRLASIVPQPTTLPRAPDVDNSDYIIFHTKNDIRWKLCISREREILRKVNGELELTKTRI